MDRAQIIEDLKTWTQDDPNGTGQIYLDQLLDKINELEEWYE